MNQVLNKLYQFAGEYQIDQFCKQEQKELDDNEKLCAAIVGDLNDVLSPPWQRRLEEYIYGRDVRESIQTEAYFCSGFAMGLYLGGLGGALTV